MDDFSDKSRDELLAIAKSQAAMLLQIQNRPNIVPCPFCMQIGWVSAMKMQLKESLIDAWMTDVTQDELTAYVEELRKKYPPAPLPVM